MPERPSEPTSDQFQATGTLTVYFSWTSASVAPPLLAGPDFVIQIDVAAL